MTLVASQTFSKTKEIDLLLLNKLLLNLLVALVQKSFSGPLNLIAY